MTGFWTAEKEASVIKLIDDLNYSFRAAGHEFNRIWGVNIARNTIITAYRRIKVRQQGVRVSHDQYDHLTIDPLVGTYRVVVGDARISLPALKSLGHETSYRDHPRAFAFAR